MLRHFTATIRRSSSGHLRTKPRASAILAAAVGLFMVGAPVSASPQDETPPSPLGPPEEITTIGELAFTHLSFDDAISRAERTGRLLVLYWVSPKEAQNQRFEDEVLTDPQVQRWIEQNALPVRIDVAGGTRDLNRNGLKSSQLPSVDVFDLARGGRVERIGAAGDATMFLAGVLGIGVVEQPSGEDLTEPFRWLAWANACFRDGLDTSSGMRAAGAYGWCLVNGETYRPGFRATYSEFILNRLAYLRKRTPKALEILSQERNRLMRQIKGGKATKRDVYDITRIDFWVRSVMSTKDTYMELKGLGPKQETYRRWLFPVVVPILGRYQEYDEILELVGDGHLTMFQERMATIAPSSTEDGTNGEAEGKPTEAQDAPLESPKPKKAEGDDPAETAETTDPEKEEREPQSPFAAVETRADIIEDASWVYEALLARDRDEQAQELASLIITAYPINRSFGLFVERSLRTKKWAAAAELADTGMGVLDERGQGRMRRLLGRIPASADDSDGK